MIAFPLLVVLMLAVVDIGMEYGSKIAVTDAARSASVRVATGGAGSDATCTVSGTAPDAETLKLVCLAKTSTRMSDDRVAVKVFYLDRNGASSNDLTAARMPQNASAVVVCVSASTRSISGLLGPVLEGRFLHARSITATTRSSFDGMPSPWEEDVLRSDGATDSWDWCTVGLPDLT